MGREIRRVIPNWEHPKEVKYSYRLDKYNKVFKVMYDMPFSKAINIWIEEYNEWLKDDEGYSLEDSIGSPPQIKYYRPEWKKEDMTWYQVYETVSEGTPISPPFETKEELVDWLYTNLDYWGKTWTKEQSVDFVMGSGFTMSGVCIDGKCMAGYKYVPKNKTLKEIK